MPLFLLYGAHYKRFLHLYSYLFLVQTSIMKIKCFVSSWYTSDHQDSQVLLESAETSTCEGLVWQDDARRLAQRVLLRDERLHCNTSATAPTNTSHTCVCPISSDISEWYKRQVGSLSGWCSKISYADVNDISSDGGQSIMGRHISDP